MELKITFFSENYLDSLKIYMKFQFFEKLL